MNELMTVHDGTSAEAVEGLLSVCFPDAATILDPTFGNGMFYAGSARKVYGGDLDPLRAKSFVGSYEAIPAQDKSVDVVVFDPPFQPLSRNGEGLIGRRFTKVRGESGEGFGIDAMLRLKESVQIGVLEAERVSRLGIIVKVQDYIHSRRPVWMSMWLWEILGEPYDFLQLRQKSKLKSPKWQNQLSVWRNHSTFWVYRFDHRGNYHTARRPVSGTIAE